ncbi:2308_t:CDS:2, partial [Ambispora leptoticha]
IFKRKPKGKKSSSISAPYSSTKRKQKRASGTIEKSEIHKNDLEALFVRFATSEARNPYVHIP